MRRNLFELISFKFLKLGKHCQESKTSRMTRVLFSVRVMYTISMGVHALVCFCGGQSRILSGIFPMGPCLPCCLDRVSH